ncbi:MAG: DPP IV N-terminal domain-containing protein, partial [Actinomycetota bacterium]
MSDTFPRQYARTQRLTLGEPRTITVSPDGRRVVFCRAASGTNPLTSLWVFDVESSRERCVADAHQLMDSTAGSESDFERARRERAREGAAGIVTYSCNDDVTKATFSMAGRLFVVDLTDSTVVDVTPEDVESALYDPRLSPCGRRIAYVVGNDVHVRLEDGSTCVIA